MRLGLLLVILGAAACSGNNSGNQDGSVSAGALPDAQSAVERCVELSMRWQALADALDDRCDDDLDCVVGGLLREQQCLRAPYLSRSCHGAPLLRDAWLASSEMRAIEQEFGKTCTFDLCATYPVELGCTSDCAHFAVSCVQGHCSGRERGCFETDAGS